MLQSGKSGIFCATGNKGYFKTDDGSGWWIPKDVDEFVCCCYGHVDRAIHSTPNLFSTSQGTFMPKMEKPKTPNLIFRLYV